MVIGMDEKKSPTPTLSRERGRAAKRPGEGKPAAVPKKVPETGGPEGPEPTRYGDWERKGRCIDF